MCKVSIQSNVARFWLQNQLGHLQIHGDIVGGFKAQTLTIEVQKHDHPPRLSSNTFDNPLPQTTEIAHRTSWKVRWRVVECECLVESLWKLANDR